MKQPAALRTFPILYPAQRSRFAMTRFIYPTKREGFAGTPFTVKRINGVGPQRELSALTLFVIGILGADNHNSAVSFDDLAFVAHRLYTGSDFHSEPPISSYFFDLTCCGR